MYVFHIENKTNIYPVLINDTEINVIIDSTYYTIYSIYYTIYSIYYAISVFYENSFNSFMPQPKLNK